MIDLDIDCFMTGINDYLDFAKTASIEDQSHTSFFPTLNTQESWKYDKEDDKLHLHRGHQTFSFTFPKDLDNDESHLIKRLPDGEVISASKSGTAQVHRSDPGFVYVTLHDGASNPTLTLQHQSSSNWKLIPKKKLKKMLPTTSSSSITVDPEALIEGAKKEAGALDPMASLVGSTVSNGPSVLGSAAPYLSSIGGPMLQGAENFGSKALHGFAANPVGTGVKAMAMAYLANLVSKKVRGQGIFHGAGDYAVPGLVAGGLSTALHASGLPSDSLRYLPPI